MTEMSQNTNDTSRRSLVRHAPLAAILLTAVVGAFFLHDHLSFDTLRDNKEALVAFREDNLALMLSSFVLGYIVLVAFSLPGATVATLTGGFLFGTALGTVVNVTGATLGATVIFLAARMGAGDVLKRRMDASEGMVRKIKAGIDENQWSMLFLIRLVPVVPFFLANLIPAFLGVSTFRFVVSTFLGIIPGAIVYTSVGAGLGEVFEMGEKPDLGIIFEAHILLPILGLCALSLLPVLLKTVTGKKDLLK